MSGNKNRYKEEREKAEWLMEKKIKVMNEMRGNSVMMNYLSPYEEEDIEEFIAHYAKEKVRVLDLAPQIASIQEAAGLRWVEDAMDRLEEIQQKKFFDLQCLWRAESVQVEGIEIAEDFQLWERSILNCPFIEPVSEEDLELYRRYLLSSNFEDKQGWFDSWQDYDEIKEAYQTEGENRNFPDWYDFHNGLTGKGMLLSLPDVRGNKENYYIELALVEERKKRKANADSQAQAPASSVPPSLPSIDYHKNGFVDWFVHTFDNFETQGHFCDYGGDRIWNKTEEEKEDDEVHEWVDFLSEDAEVFPIRGWYNWREGLERCVEDYRRYKIAEALPAAFEQYNMYQSNGLSFPEANNGAWKEVREIILKQILRGREICGEPQDLNF